MHTARLGTGCYGIVTEACGLLARRLGAERIASEPEAAGEIVERCARLPLAIAAARGMLLPAGTAACGNSNMSIDIDNCLSGALSMVCSLRAAPPPPGQLPVLGSSLVLGCRNWR